MVIYTAVRSSTLSGVNIDKVHLSAGVLGDNTWVGNDRRESRHNSEAYYLLTNIYQHLFKTN